MHTQWTENSDSSPLYRYLHIITGPPATGCALPTPPPPLQSLTQTLLSHPNLIAFSYNKYPRAWTEQNAERAAGPGWLDPAGHGKGGKFL